MKKYWNAHLKKKILIEDSSKPHAMSKEEKLALEDFATLESNIINGDVVHYIKVSLPNQISELISSVQPTNDDGDNFWSDF